MKPNHPGHQDRVDQTRHYPKTKYQIHLNQGSTTRTFLSQHDLFLDICLDSANLLCRLLTPVVVESLALRATDVIKQGVQRNHFGANQHFLILI